jgi:hypothetical protein
VIPVWLWWGSFVATGFVVYLTWRQWGTETFGLLSRDKEPIVYWIVFGAQVAAVLCMVLFLFMTANASFRQ